MIVSRSSRLPRKKLLLAVGDAVCTALAMVAAVMLRLGWTSGLEYLQARQSAILISWGVFVLAFYIGGLYESERLQSLGKTLAATVISVAVGVVLITGFFYASFSIEIGRGIFLGFAAFVFVAGLLKVSRLDLTEAQLFGAVQQVVQTALLFCIFGLLLHRKSNAA